MLAVHNPMNLLIWMSRWEAENCAQFLNIYENTFAYFSNVILHAHSGRYANEVRVMHMSEKREKFVRLANNRVNKAIDQLRLVGNLGNRAAYEFSEEDAKKITRALQRACDATKDRLLGSGESGSNTFSLD